MKFLNDKITDRRQITRKPVIGPVFFKKKKTIENHKSRNLRQ